MAGVLVGAGFAVAHGGGVLAQGSPARIHQELIATFGEKTAFSATAVMKSKSPSGEGLERFSYTFSHGMLRLDRTSNDNPFLPEVFRKMRRDRGIDVWYEIVRPTDRTMVFPKRKVYAVDADTHEPPSRIESTPLEKATLEGRACVRERLSIDNGQGATDLIVWRPADDPKGIPVRIENEHGGSTTILEFEDVKREEPDPALFEPPTRFEKYPSILELSKALAHPPSEMPMSGQ